MRPPASTRHSKDHFLNRIIIVGLSSGALITALIWLKVPNQITTPLTWFSLSLIGLGSFLQLRQPSAPYPRRIMMLATLAAVSLVYLFPELFGPACGGMPRAFALNCEPECRVKECTKWVAGPSPECPKPGPGGGCCLSEITVCDPKCEPPPPPNQPPTITGTLSCGQWGENGWCVNNATLILVATEPQGKQVLISGAVAGTSFACPAGNGSASCSLPLPEGANTVNYLATSSTGLTASGSKAYKYDATQPQISGTVNGITGSNGWYISPVEVGASASDPLPGSGLAAFEYNLNGGGWGNYTGPLSLSDGVHSLSLRASDAAGNIVETSQAIRVDTVTPALDLSAEGAVGTNGWYISTVKISAAASDSGSGVNAFEYDLDGLGWTPYSGALELPDGTHSLSLRVIDNAGNITAGTQTFMVDTFAPTIDLSLTGTEGANGWHTSTVQVSALASDAGFSPSGISGLSTLEVSVDGGSWETYTTPLAFNDGLHTYQFRTTDNAGNLTKTSLQQLKVDTIPPSIILPESWVLGNAAYFELQDGGSGLASIRLVIEDEDERYPKATWEDALSSYKFKGEIDWDGRFKDGQLAPSGGEYYAWLKATDKAGNEGRQAGQIIVEDEIPPSDHLTGGLVTATEIPEPLTPPEFPSLVTGETHESQPPAASGAPAISFGGGNNGAAQPTSAQAGIASFSVGGQSTSPINNSPSNILWGATAAAAIGAFTAEIARRKQEEQAKAMERAARQESRANSNYRQKIKAKKTAQLEAVWAAERALAEQRKQAAINPRLTSKEETVEAEMRAYTNKPQELGEAYYQYMAQKAYEAYRAQEVASFTTLQSEQPEKSIEKNDEVKSWWETAIDWVDKHQKETSIGIGVTTGLIAVGLTLAAAATAVVTLPVLLVAAGAAAVVAGASVAIGTGLLNNYYGRDLTTNIWSNIGAATVSAALTTGLGLFLLGGGFTSALINIGNSAAALCANYQTVCKYTEPVTKGIDFLEETGLMIKATVQTWKGDSVGASETALELQMEHLDGGMPGNAIAKEITDEVNEWARIYGDDVVDFVRLYGKDAVDVIRLHKDDAVKIIRDYGKNGIKLLKTYSNNAVDFVKRSERLGINPTNILDNPPLPGQTLEGWMLGIDNPENPVNMQLKLNLMDNEITQLKKESIQNPNSRLFSIGYGKDAPIPFNKFAEHFGDDYKMSFLGVSDTNWQRFDNAKAYGDFWKFNSDAIEWGIEERKIFILNVPYDLATNPSPSSTKRFSLAEIRLIEMPANSYTRIEKGEYSFFVPNELLDSYEDYLPPELK